MSISPIITFKAGLCEHNEATGKVTPSPEPGYIYLYNDEDLLHFCWRRRSASLDEPEMDLIMFPADGDFTPYRKKSTNGRIFVLKFQSSSQRHLFWLQSKSQSSAGDPSYYSTRDIKIGEVVNDLLQGEQVDIEEAVNDMRTGHPPNDDEDATMEDVEGHGTNDSSRPGAAGGDLREEGEGPREGGADGGRAPGEALDAQTVIQNFLRSMPGSGAARAQPQQKLFTTLQDLLTPSVTVDWVEHASETTVDQLMQYLPPNLTSLARDEDDETTPATPSLKQKKDLVKRVLRSPQFTQSLASLTFAIRDGGLPSIGEALNIPLQNGGYMRRGGVPLGGGEAVEAFVNGVKDLVDKKDDDGDDDRMDTY